jgi:hypothetical protein
MGRAGVLGTATTTGGRHEARILPQAQPAAPGTGLAAMTSGMGW